MTSWSTSGKYVQPMYVSWYKFNPCCWPLRTTPVDQAIKGHLILQTATHSLNTETCTALPISVRWDIWTQKYLCVSLQSCLRSTSVNNCSIKLTWRDIIQFFSASSYPLSKLWLVNIHKISHVWQRSLWIAVVEFNSGSCSATLPRWIRQR